MRRPSRLVTTTAVLGTTALALGGCVASVRGAPPPPGSQWTVIAPSEATAAAPGAQHVTPAPAFDGQGQVFVPTQYADEEMLHHCQMP